MKLALAGDTMLGRSVADRLASAPPDSLFAPEVVQVIREADLFVLNLECCISDRGEPWYRPGKPFFFRAPPVAAEALAHLGVSCVTLANNHALDFGERALLDTFDHLASAGIAWVGAGPNVDQARAPVVLEAGGIRLGVVGFTDHPEDFAAGSDSAGVALAGLERGIPAWLSDTIRSVRSRCDAVLITPHWGPNMTAEPVGHVRRAAEGLVAAGATVVAGHSAHVFHGVEGQILYDLGDFLDDYAVEPVLRNDLGLLFLVTLDERGPVRLEVIPLRLDFCHTRVAEDKDAAWIEQRFREACGAFDTEVSAERGRLMVAWR
jgi:poly-gamma-glutamate capsule biosynthesis protein CapA/YwtB (metallophosphatase superfamily)